MSVYLTSVYAIIVNQKRLDGLGKVSVAHKQTHKDIGNAKVLIDTMVLKKMNK